MKAKAAAINKKEVVLEDNSKLAFLMHADNTVSVQRTNRRGKTYSSQPLNLQEGKELKEALETCAKRVIEEDPDSALDSIWIGPKHPTYLYNPKLSVDIFSADGQIGGRLIAYISIGGPRGGEGENFFVENPHDLIECANSLEKLLQEGI